MKPPITSKSDMYARLAAGEFGNTIPQYFSVAEWKASGDHERYAFWGVRSATASMHPACRMNVPAAEVEEYANTHFPGSANISMMVDTVAGVKAFIEVWDSPTGLVVEGVENPKISEGWTWRNSMREPTRRRAWSGIAARHVLARYLNENSLADLWELIEEYPDHVIELSALSRCIGHLKGRNAVVWEIRQY